MRKDRIRKGTLPNGLTYYVQVDVDPIANKVRITSDVFPQRWERIGLSLTAERCVGVKRVRENCSVRDAVVDSFHGRRGLLPDGTYYGVQVKRWGYRFAPPGIAYDVFSQKGMETPANDDMRVPTFSRSKLLLYGIHESRVDIEAGEHLILRDYHTTPPVP